MVYTTYLWWFGGWFIIVLTTLYQIPRIDLFFGFGKWKTNTQSPGDDILVVSMEIPKMVYNGKYSLNGWSIAISGTKMEVPTIYKAYIRPM